MLMMLIMRVPVFVLHSFMTMLMPVSFRQMQPNADRHQRRHRQKIGRGSVAQQGNRDRSTGEWRQREVRAGSCSANMPQREDKESEAYTVAQKAN